MIVEFFRYGAGLSKGPLDYFLGKKRDREHARVLSGNEQEVAGLIDSSPFAKKYTSGCLSFYESDLSDEAKRKIMADFEHCLFPGMSSDQYRVLWIEHKDKLNEETGERRLELNFLIPNTEILTGNRLQPFYHEADMPRVDLFKKIINFEHQLHDPDDPMFRQDIKTKKSLPKNTADIKRVLDVAARKQIEGGFITDRESMKKWLTALGLEITGVKPNSISIRNPHNDDEKSRPIRLTGAIYEQNLDLEQRAIALQQQHQRDTEEKLERGMEKIFSDTQNKLTARSGNLSRSISQLTLKLRKEDNKATKDLTSQILSNKEALKNQQSEATSEIIEQITTDKNTLQKAHTEALNELQAALQKQVESLQESLQESNRLQEEIVRQATLKKALITSVWPLIILVGVLVTSSIGTGLYLNHQKNQLSRMNQQIEDLRVRGATLTLSTCDKQLCVQIDPKAPHYEGNYRVIVEK